MKQTLSTIVIAIYTIAIFAQPNKVVSAYNYLKYYNQDKKYDDLKKAKAAIDEATLHDDTKDKAKTYLYRGDIYMALFDYSRDAEIKKSTEADDSKKRFAGYRALSMTELDEAYNAYKKMHELDLKKGYSDDFERQIKVVYSDYMDKANAEINGKMYAESIPYYESVLEIGAKYLNKIDTASLYNAGFCYEQKEDYAKAKEIYFRVADMKFMGHKSNLALIRIYTKMNDTINVKKEIDKAKISYPGNLDIIIEEINYYLKQDKAPQAIRSLEAGIEADPKNAELHLILGQTYNKMAFQKDVSGKEMPKPAKYDEYIKNAENQLLKSIELNKNYTNAYYTLGYFYSNQGAMIYNAAQKLTDIQALSKQEKVADGFFIKAIPYLEKTLELEPTDKETMKALKQLYLKTNQADTEKYKKVDVMLKK